VPKEKCLGSLFFEGFFHERLWLTSLYSYLLRCESIFPYENIFLGDRCILEIIRPFFSGSNGNSKGK
jgi:hypothetical protein